MNALTALVIVAAIGQTPVDRGELAKAQSALEAYLSGIKAIQLTYSEKWTPPDPEAYKREHDTWDPTLVNDHDLLYAYASVRMKNLERRRDLDGKIVESRWDVYLHDGKRTDINHTGKTVHVLTKMDSDPFPSLPLDAFGLRVTPTQNMLLSDLLKLPDVTAIEGEERIDGERVIVLKIGPKIPESARPKHWNDASYVKAALAPDRNYLPLRMEFYPQLKSWPDRCWRYSVGALRPITDKSINRTVDFPHRMEVQWPNGGRTTWVVQSAVINPKVSDDDFVVTPPAGHSVTTEGENPLARTVQPDPKDMSPNPLSVTVLSDEGKPVVGAKLAMWSLNAWLIDTHFNATSTPAKPIAETTTDADGKAVFPSFPLSGLTVVSRHNEYRTTAFRQIGDYRTAVLRLPPKTPVTVRDEEGQPAKGIAVVVDIAMTIEHVLIPQLSGFELEDRTGEDGRAAVTWESPSRRSHEPCAFLATNRSGSRIAIAVRAANDLRRPVELTLRPTRPVRVTIDMGAATMSAPTVRWADQQGRVFFAGLSTRLGEHPAQFEAQVRLPPGAYQLNVFKSHDEDLVLPFAVVAGKDALDLGVVTIAPSRLAQLNGSEAQELEVQWRDGHAQRFVDLRGKVVVLYFWATWCGPCLQQMPAMMELKEKLSKEPVEWIAIHDASIEDFAELDQRLGDLERQLWADKKLSLLTVLDKAPEDAYRGATASAYGVRTWPTVVLVDRAGKVVAPVEKDKLEQAIRDLLK